MNKKYKIAKYVRLSKKDNLNDESNSIKNQKKLIDNFINNNFNINYYILFEFVDDRVL